MNKKRAITAKPAARRAVSPTATPAPSLIGEYMADMSRHQQRLTTQQEAKLAARARRGEPEAIDSLFRAHMAQVLWLVKPFHRRIPWIPIEDMIQAGNMGLLNAIRRFDPKIATLSTYCHRGIVFGIQREIQRQLRYRTVEFNPDSNPTSEGDEFLFGDYTKRKLSMATVPGNELCPAEAALERDEARSDRAIVREAVRYLRRKDSRLATVLLGRYRGRTLLEIGSELNISRERVRQLEQVAVNLLRKHFEDRGALPPVPKGKSYKTEAKT